MEEKLIVTLTTGELENLIDRVISKRLPQDTAPVATDPLPELLTRDQAAQFLGVSKGSIDNYSRVGLLRKRYLGRLPRFHRDELRKIFESWKEGH